MGCSSSSSSDYKPPPKTGGPAASSGHKSPQTSGGPAPPVERRYAEGFLTALRAEYVQGVQNAVGDYFDRGIPDNVVSKLEPFEDQVRQSGNKQSAISQLSSAWGMGAQAIQVQSSPSTAVGQRDSQYVSSQPSMEQRTTDDASLTAVRTSLGLAPNMAPRDVALSGLQSSDLEVVRNAINVGNKSGLSGTPEMKNAESRLRAERCIPLDWDMNTYASGRFLEGGMGGRKASTVVAYEQQPPHVVAEMQGMFDATYRKVYTRDRRGAPIPDRFAVREVVRVMNDQVWREYANHREQLRSKLAGSNPAVPDGSHTMNYLAKRRAKASASLPALDSQVNENWLFHGTTKEAANGIAENDFRLDMTGSNAGTLYGKGIYLAENVTKSDEYGEGPKGPAGEQMEAGYEAPRPPPGPPPALVRESYILVCRSAMGRVYYTDEQRPDADALQRKCLNGEYDSVLGDRLKRNGTFRELIVYHDDLVYPEYIVRYERVFFHESFAEIYSNMCKRKRQGTFNGPTPDEKEVLTSMWNVYGMPNKGRINKWQLLDLLTAIEQPPENEAEDLDATFQEWDTKKDGWIDCEEFLQEMTQRVNDGIEYYM
eukprot:TRINITY_DN17824_c0_g1_i1.p1 TRINITY_DN17824_c0_g1~~TRINITY_DN17824_c0_g1_i1.p1  ORF type:complete len:597 (-),score=72.22 TRINITY_DN17824_c0_g1_i1:314-2104(-)